MIHRVLDTGNKQLEVHTIKTQKLRNDETRKETLRTVLNVCDK